MLQFYQKRSWRGVAYSPVTVVLLGLVTIVLGYAVYDRYAIATEMEDRHLAEEAAVAKLREQKAALEKRVEYLSNERGIEAEMRRNFDIALPGEQVVIIMDEPTSTSTVTPLPSVSENRPWYQFW